MANRVLLALAFIMSVGPAFAQTVAVPEPASIAMLGAGAVAMYIVQKFGGRK